MVESLKRYGMEEIMGLGVHKLTYTREVGGREIINITSLVAETQVKETYGELPRIKDQAWNPFYIKHESRREKNRAVFHVDFYLFSFSFLRERKRERLLSSILDFSQSSLIINEQRSLIMRQGCQSLLRSSKIYHQTNYI